MALDQINHNDIGSLKISDEVISKVSEIALEDVSGVVGIADGSKNFGFGIIPGNILKGVRAEMKDNCVVVNLDIVVKYGVVIPDVAWEAQGKIKKAVESMTGLTVQSVNISVKDIQLPEEAVPAAKTDADPSADEEPTCDTE